MEGATPTLQMKGLGDHTHTRTHAHGFRRHVCGPMLLSNMGTNAELGVFKATRQEEVM